ncbi:MAG TPA: ATP-binding cassette domain-containing protein [Bauldia sp.]|nr:ATP-binding cassette domain-containing protein [Bauldia sp.]
MSDAPLLAARNIRKSFGAIEALSGVSLTVHAGRVTCLLGDNGAGKSTLIKILSGVFAPDTGDIMLGGVRITFRSARDALDAGIATVYQDLAVVPVMPIYRNFFLGREPEMGWGPLRRFDKQTAIRVASEEIARIGINVRDVHRPIMTLSGGERQSVAIARAIHFGARVLILDEPTSALGVKEAEIVLRYIRRARDKGIGIVFITHNVHHAWLIGDSFEILKRGSVSVTFEKAGLTKDELLTQMAGGDDLARLAIDFDAAATA